MHSATDGFFFLSDSLLRQLIRWKLALVDQMFCQESIHLRSIILHPSSMTHKTCHLNPFHGPAQPNALWPVKLPFPDLLELSQPEDVAMENAKLQPGTLQLHKRNHLSTPTSYRKIPCLSLFGYGFSFFAAAPKLNTSHKTHTHT